MGKLAEMYATLQEGIANLARAGVRAKPVTYKEEVMPLPTRSAAEVTAITTVGDPDRVKRVLDNMSLQDTDVMTRDLRYRQKR